MTTWNTLHQDAFTRANGDLNLDTMTDGVGAWAQVQGQIDVVSNQAKGVSAGVTGLYKDSVMSAQGDTRVFATVKALGDSGGGVTAWFQNASNYLLAYFAIAGVWYLYKVVGGTFTQLATGGTATVGDEIAGVVEGTSFSLEDNGSTILGPVSVAGIGFSSGAAGLYLPPNGEVDGWGVQTPAASTAHHLTLLGVG